MYHFSTSLFNLIEILLEIIQVYMAYEQDFNY